MKNKLLLLAVALLTSWSVKAVDHIEEGVDYYIMNVETGRFLSAHNDWGTRGSLTENANAFRFVPGKTGAGYNIQDMLVSVGNKYLGANLYTDNNGQMAVKDEEAGEGKTKNIDGIWEIKPQNDGEFAFFCGSSWEYKNNAWVETKHGYLANGAAGVTKGTVLAFSEELTSACRFRLMTYGELKAYLATSSQNDDDIRFTALIKNGDFCRNVNNTVWGYTHLSGDNHNYGGGVENNFCAESWHCSFICNQKIVKLPAGSYKLKAQGFYRNDTGGELAEDQVPYFYVGNAYNDYIAKVDVPEKTGTEDNMGDASNSFRAGNYEADVVSFTIPATQDVEVGIHSPNNTLWVIWDNFRLTNDGPVAMYTASDYAAELFAGITPVDLDKVTASKTVEDAYTAAYNTLKAYSEDLPAGTTIADVDDEYAKFAAAEIALNKSIATWAPYIAAADSAENLYNQIATQLDPVTGEPKYKVNNYILALGDYLQGAASTFDPGKSSYGIVFVNGCREYILNNTVLDDEQITAEVAFLKDLRTEAMTNSVQPGMDVTFLLVNPDLTHPTAGYGWTGTVTSAKGGLSGWPCAEKYGSGTFDFYQVVENAPVGLYRIWVNAFFRPTRSGGTGEEPVPVSVYMGTVANPIQHLLTDDPQTMVVNDLTQEGDKWVSESGNAKNGTNIYYDGGADADISAETTNALLADNVNDNPTIQEAIKTSTVLSGRNGDRDFEFKGQTIITPNGMVGASIAFSAGRYPMSAKGEVTPTVEGGKTGTLRIGIKTTSAMDGDDWALWSNFRLELLGDDPDLMRELLQEKVNELRAVFPWEMSPEGPSYNLMTLVNEKIPEFESIIAKMTATYEELKAAYDEAAALTDRANEYNVAYNDFTVKKGTLSDWATEHTGDPSLAQAVEFAQDVVTVYEGLAGIWFLCTTPEDVAEIKELMGGECEDVTKENLKDVVEAGATEGGYVSTYAQFVKFYELADKMFHSIILDPSLDTEHAGTAADPKDLTDQLQNPDFESGDQWWGTDWAINFTAGEMYEKVFDTYQNVYMPAGHYTLQGFAMDRRDNWANVLANEADWRLNDATYLYAKLVNANDTLKTEVANAKFVAQTTDITPEGVTITKTGDYYTPNSMEQYRNWMDAKDDFGFAFGTELSFTVDEDSYASLGFFRRAYEGASWFIADGIKLFYCADADPATGIVAPTSLEKYGKPDGKYLEKNQIFIYLNGKKFNTAGQIVK